MIALNGLDLEPAGTPHHRTLRDNHGLAPEEALAAAFEAERVV
jgi:hypothetical protein